jgi:hypothetical protein
MWAVREIWRILAKELVVLRRSILVLATATPVRQCRATDFRIRVRPAPPPVTDAAGVLDVRSIAGPHLFKSHRRATHNLAWVSHRMWRVTQRRHNGPIGSARPADSALGAAPYRRAFQELAQFQINQGNRHKVFARLGCKHTGVLPLKLVHAPGSALGDRIDGRPPLHRWSQFSSN